MMANLFSIFDPASTLSLPLNWFASTLGLFLLPWVYWVQSNRYHKMFSMISNQLHLEFKTLVGPASSQGHTLIFISLFMFILFNNLLGLAPYVFTASSHLAMTLSLAMPLWFSFMIYGWFNHTRHMLAHLVPLGTPGILMPFMVLIETISNLIRPGTLAVRLAANMIAGHLLLVLLGNQGPSLSSSLLSFLLGTQILLLTLEGAVAVIQSYVFAVLATLYSSEVV
ncbi:ATP synthase F0 subunit 6 (mitochondrion) [Daphnia magna]|uniref:ATP synthase subunit a n=1 Tax=Daphnia magna TaxID=35525 RepID=A0A0A0RWZ4_9CRUS|nr:ATP synthase F0 subunit 6 [Daphnia magna]AIW06377.1 ATP synthase F0 subunit 6 [Daphnia magna]AKC58391.1 ATPase subunit 6 [Daphnia magna]AYE40658.1 ATP synthase F0 subunit 6 [Daphnia magna]AYE40814.1 ATP synthase F0 subunit 6 [Daphnia magna]AYE40827.1 ATP synthase F0 subunit 6 [Daphnia magna]